MPKSLFLHVFNYLLCFVLGLLSSVQLFAQESPRAFINKVMSTADTFARGKAIEKIYLQTNKPNYEVGDTLWFKGYLLEEPTLHAAAKSGILYVELSNDSNRVIKRVMMPLFGGLAFGNIALSEKEILQGGYFLRAYTNWMRNFGESYVFKKHFYIGNAVSNAWLVNYMASTQKSADKEKVQLNLRVTKFDTFPVGVREMQLRLTDGKRTLLKNNVSTDLDGIIAANFDLPEKANAANLSITMQDLRKGEDNRRLVMPLILNRPDHIDLQFMPEGGELVAGLPARIAFKALNEDGYGVNISGKIYNSKQQEMAAFIAAHKGMGVFNLLPQQDEIYTAKIKLPDGSFKTFALPAVKSSGITLQVNSPLNTDSVEVLLNATPDVIAAGNVYYLLGQTHGLVAYGASLHFKNGGVRLQAGRNLFPNGILRFLLIGADKKLLNERKVFIDHNDNLKIGVSSNNTIYAQRDSVIVDIEVKGVSGNPVQGSFSMAVTDNAQVKTDSVANGTIKSYMLLTSDLKGTIEEPGYYDAAGKDARKWQHLDQLLLTQGWVGYDWKELRAPATSPVYTAEKQFLITGHVTNMFNKPVANSGVTLFSKKPMIVTDTVTNKQGEFIFKDIFPADTAVFFIQARNKKGKSFNVGIEMDEFKPPVFAAVNDRATPWFLNIDTNSMLRVKKQLSLKDEMTKITGGNVLKEVVVKDKRIIKDSKNLNGPGEADLIIDEETLQKASRTSLGDLITKNVKGFNLYTDKTGLSYYRLNTMALHLIIDGMDIEFFKPETLSPYLYFKEYLDYYDAEEIKGIEVMKSMRNTFSYTRRYIKNPMAEPDENAFIEITTRGGRGPFVKKAVGTYVYRPMSFSMPVQFYAPKYKPASTADMTDIRSTVHWAPHIVTDKEGKARVSFYTADNPGDYTYIIEGTDLEGSFGVKRGTLTVKKSNLNQ
ncbi:carboxypeptidase-like regulatory domain-containing protein [Mucilaginibacter rubeus]|uniref:Carboxypeptidase regulatory-like domain-containing protein n=1 Tax=Mucilaginibacter rubeus TaxID=2027860 RepID=A0A5C1HVL0_9SPHI|nr:carboxypeptidase-like regulatory domain-containing protein [Mucilaginibacter rubeus]QEM09844.1 carboxypeptidase regulatory-like domain-containing protein [Mucilaginibacter rubeus]